MSWLGLDIGGASLKAADGRGWAWSVPFPLWREPGRLADKIAELLAVAPRADRLAVTMTGELCDCFRTKAEGVRHILSSVKQEAADRSIRVYAVDGRFTSFSEACELPYRVAASNWHALAQFACRFVRGRTGLLIDVGSTTTDVVPLADGQPCTRGTTDLERLANGELLYSGVGRTPICAVTRSLPWRDIDCPVAAELYATTADAYVLLGELQEQPESVCTADGRPLTVEYSHERLARMLCADHASFTLDDAQHAAAAVRDMQLARLRDAITQLTLRMPSPPSCFVASGVGEFLARAAIAQLEAPVPVFSLANELGPVVSECAPAHAVAVLASELEVA
jgi:hypothetical protein